MCAEVESCGIAHSSAWQWGLPGRRLLYLRNKAESSHTSNNNNDKFRATIHSAHVRHTKNAILMQGKSKCPRDPVCMDGLLTVMDIHDSQKLIDAQ